MPPIRCSPFLLAFVSFAAVAHAQPPAPFPALLQLEVEGNKTFDRDAIRLALAVDAGAMAALGARTGMLAGDAADVVAERVATAYRHKGFADVDVAGSMRGAAVHLSIAEGPRSRCGDVRFTGNTVLANAALHAALRVQRGDEVGEAMWKPGEFVPFDEGFSRRVEIAIVAAYRDIGRHGVRVRAGWQRDGDLVHLTISVEDEGHETRVREIELLGETEAAQGLVTQWIGWPAGTLLTTERLRWLHDRIAALGRYRSVSIPSEDLPAELAVLPVTVRLLPGARLPDVFEARDIEQVQMGLRSLVASLRSGKPLRVTAHVTERSDVGPLSLLPGIVTVDFGNGGFAVHWQRIQLAGHDAGPGDFVMTTGAMTLALGEGLRATSTFAHAIGFAAQIRLDVSGDGKRELRWGVGVSTKKQAALFDVFVHPGFAARLLADPGIRRDGDDVLLGSEHTHVRIGPGGVLKTREIELPIATYGVWRFELRDEAVDPVAAGLPAEQTRTVAELLGVIAIEALSRRIGPALAERPEASALLRRSLAFLLEGGLVHEPLSASERFTVPANASATQAQADVFAILFAMATVVGEPCPWLSTLCGTGWGLVSGGRTANDAMRQLTAMADDPQLGPIALGAAAALADFVGQPRVAVRLRDALLQRVSFDAFHREVMALIGASDVATRTMHGLVASWRGASELAALFADLPDDAAADSAAFRQALFVLWQAGLEGIVRDWLAGGG